MAGVKNEDKRQVVAGSGKLIIVIYYVTKIKNNSYVVEAL